MFEKEIYIHRRNVLKKEVGEGVILLPGNNEAPMNYPSNTYKFRQDSNFLYYFGIDRPDLAGIIDVDNNQEIIFGDEFTIDDIIWMGSQNTIAELSEKCGVLNTRTMKDLEQFLKNITNSNRTLHFLPQYRMDILLKISQYISIPPAEVNQNTSEKLIKSVIKQRSIKSEEEIEQIESAIEISYLMNTAAMQLTQPGKIESEIFGVIEGITLSIGNGVSFPVIFSVRGETLHNHNHENVMKNGDLALLDSGAESLLHYASDITRTFPVNGKFTSKQKDIYNIVLNSQINAIELCGPGVKFKDIHLETAKIIADGLKSCGLMKGNVEDAVSAGAHALFFPHGLGHMLGLDVHDMEGLGENLVGYGSDESRSDQFGLAYLRLAKELRPGFTVTIEPGIYFIPELINLWKSENKFSEFINYSRLEEYKKFGGIRIEDDILITESGSRVLGKIPIPKSVTDVEETCQTQ